MAMRKYYQQFRVGSVYMLSIPKRSCFLKPMEPEDTTIPLHSGVNTLGRSKDTGIRDLRCSKRQLELEVDLNQACIKLKVLGVNPCSVNGLMLMQNTECELIHGDVLELVYGRHRFEVVFRPPPTEQKQVVPDGNMKNCEAHGASEKESWDTIENGKVLIFTSAGVKASEKIAAYDIDGTIITTISGNVFPKTTDDWRIIYAEVPKKLQLLHEDGYKICFFTNQGGIATGKVKVDDFKQKVKDILKKLGVPVQVFVAVQEGHYRKPLPGMWKHLLEHKNNGVKVILAKCFYVGDAAGRPEKASGTAKSKKDHSSADRYFAANIGVSFYTPEEHFLSAKTEHWTKPEFEPNSVHDNVPLFEPEDTKIPADTCEMIIMVGLPGSGKSYFVQQHLAPVGYNIANADTVGSSQACLKLCERAMSTGKACVVDNTNVDIESRQKFVALANKFNVPCRCFLMNVNLEQIRHNLVYRKLTDSSHSKISDMVFNMMKKKYKPPTLDEGFTQIVRVNIKPKFSTAELEALYKLYLVEK